MTSRRFLPPLLAVAITVLGLSIGRAQDVPTAQAPYPGIAGHKSHGPAAPYPYVFLGGSRGSHYLDGDTGHGFYVYDLPYGGKVVWSYDLQKYYEDYKFVYYYEVDGNNEHLYCWAFAKYPYHHNVAVYRRFPDDHHWVFVHGAWPTIVPPGAYGAVEGRRR